MKFEPIVRDIDLRFFVSFPIDLPMELRTVDVADCLSSCHVERKSENKADCQW